MTAAESVTQGGGRRASPLSQSMVVAAAERAGVRYDDLAACTYAEGGTDIVRFLVVIDGVEWGAEDAVQWSAADIAEARGMGARAAYLESRIFAAARAVASAQKADA